MKRGFTKTFLGFSSYFASLITAFLLYSPLITFLSKTPVKAFFDQKCIEFLSKNSPDNLSKMPKFLIPAYKTAIEKGGEALSLILMKIFSFVLLIIITKLILFIAMKILNAATKFPVLKQCNTLLGGVFGIFTGALIICIFYAAISVLGAFGKFPSLIMFLQSSSVSSYIFNQNPILKFLGL